jgi:hypothetical protein
LRLSPAAASSVVLQSLGILLCNRGKSVGATAC